MKFFYSSVDNHHLRLLLQRFNHNSQLFEEKKTKQKTILTNRKLERFVTLAIADVDVDVDANTVKKTKLRVTEAQWLLLLRKGEKEKKSFGFQSNFLQFHSREEDKNVKRIIDVIRKLRRRFEIG